MKMDLQFLENLAGTEASACYDEDSDPDYIINSLWIDFGGWEFFMGDANNHILYNYSEKLEAYLSEDDLRDIEFGECWYEDLYNKIPEDLYYEISTAIEEEYEKASKEFDKFRDEFKSDIWDIQYDAEKEEIAKHNEVIIAQYGCPDWAETPNYRSWSFFMETFAAENYAHPALIMESIENDIDLYEEKFVDWTTTNGKHFVKTTRDRIICLEEYV